MTNSDVWYSFISRFWPLVFSLFGSKKKISIQATSIGTESSTRFTFRSRWLCASLGLVSLKKIILKRALFSNLSTTFILLTWLLKWKYSIDIWSWFIQNLQWISTYPVLVLLIWSKFSIFLPHVLQCKEFWATFILTKHRELTLSSVYPKTKFRTVLR